MTDANAAPPIEPADLVRRPDRTRRRATIVGIFSLTALLLAASGYLVLTVAGQPVRAAPMVLDQPASVLWGRTIDRPVEVAANNVTIRRVKIRTGGTAAVVIRSGVVGTLIEDTQVQCTSAGTDGIVPGGYSALRVRVNGCRQAFAQREGSTATIVESFVDGRPYGEATPTSPTVPIPPPDPDSRAMAQRPPYAPAAAPPTPITYWPGPTTTGVPVGTALRNSGSLSLRTAGQVVTGLNIVGCVTVSAANVQILRSRITCNSTTYSIRTLAGATNLLVQDVEINGMAKNSASICCGDYTLRRGNVYNMIDGPRLANNTRIFDSYIHSLARIAGSHNDVLQSTGGNNIIVRHNTLLSYNPVTRDPFNSCLTIGSETSPSLTNLTFEDNYCNGGNYSIGISPRLVGSNILFRNNKYGRDYRFGVVSGWNRAGVIWERATNVYFDNGLPVV
ncbi:glycoside hydrolase family protein [Plantactinospora endophytica]|uniref:Right handed beta helix domain-containing protein n=1 Tax=Plantactinospora endophytica TaxID=673535 RepID=A0ABQ4EAL4_9ACTN|nr:hypothetical protein [Plantactinospora endophytica]GIG91780.1 hypothetical protein Pen02_67160 [Plantactinospora endophytica]